MTPQEPRPYMTLDLNRPPPSGLLDRHTETYRIFLAASYARRLQMMAYCHELLECRHVVTSRWVLPPNDHLDNGVTDICTDAQRAEFAVKNQADLEVAHIVMCFTEPPGSPFGRGGRHVDLGLALALRKSVFVIGDRSGEPMQYFHPDIHHFDDWDTLRREWLYALYPRFHLPTPDWTYLPPNVP